MVKIDELPKDLQKKVRDLKETIVCITDCPYDPKTPSLPVKFAYSSLVNFIEGSDSWEFVSDIGNLRNFIREHGNKDSLRNINEIKEALEKLPTKNPYI